MNINLLICFIVMSYFYFLIIKKKHNFIENIRIVLTCIKKENILLTNLL